VDWSKPFEIKNISGGRVVIGALSIPHGEVKVIDPMTLNETILTKLKIFNDRKAIEAKNIVAMPRDKKELSVSQIETKKSINDDKNEHIIFDPNNNFKKEKAIIITEIDTNKKPIEVVSDIETEEKDIVRHKFDKTEALEFLDLHWKKLENMIKNIEDINKLQFYLDLAEKENVAIKKIELIKNRIEELQSK